MRILYFLFSFIFISSGIAQSKVSSAAAVKESFDLLSAQKESSLVKNIPFSNIGPQVMSGRVVALAVNPENTAEFYVAYASGGVWHTTTNGISLILYQKMHPPSI